MTLLNLEGLMMRKLFFIPLRLQQLTFRSWRVRPQW